MSDDGEQVFVHEITDDNSMQSDPSEEIVFPNDITFEDFMVKPDDDTTLADAPNTSALLRLGIYIKLYCIYAT